MIPAHGESGRARALRIGADVVGLLLLLVVSGKILAQASANRLLSWDMLDYFALVLEWTEHDPALVHERAYAIAKAELPPATYADWTGGDQYRQQIAGDWRLAELNNGFHRGRYLYTATVAALYGLGLRMTTATWIPNCVFWACTIALALVWARRHYPLWAASLVALAIAYSPPVMTIAPASTPDGMAMFLVALGLYVLVEHRNHLAGAAVVSLAMLARTDFVLVVFGVAAGLFLFARAPERPSLRFLVLWLAVTTAIYLGVRIAARDPGWWAVFMTAVPPRKADIASLPPFRLAFYLRALAVRTGELHYLGYDRAPDGSWVRGSDFVLVYLLAAATGIAAALRARLAQLARYQAVLLGLILGALARFLFYPYLWDRYFVSLWVPVPLCLAAIAAVLAARVRERSADER